MEDVFTNSSRTLWSLEISSPTIRFSPAPHRLIAMRKHELYPRIGFSRFGQLSTKSGNLRLAVISRIFGNAVHLRLSVAVTGLNKSNVLRSGNRIRVSKFPCEPLFETFSHFDDRQRHIRHLRKWRVVRRSDENETHETINSHSEII